MKAENEKTIYERLKEVSEEIFSKFGTDSYMIRCRLYDIRKELEHNSKAQLIEKAEKLKEFKYEGLQPYALGYNDALKKAEQFLKEQ